MVINDQENKIPFIDIQSYKGDPLAELINRKHWGRISFSLGFLGIYLINICLIIISFWIFWSDELTNQIIWAIKPTVALVYPVIFFLAWFYHWIMEASGNLFKELTESGITNNLDETKLPEVKRVEFDAQNLFSHFCWTTISLIISILVIIVVVFLTRIGFAVSTEGGHNWVGSLLLLPTSAMAVYMICMTVSRAICVIVTVKKFFKVIPVSLFPWHPDHYGGLRVLNTYAVTLTYIIGIWGFGISIFVIQTAQFGELSKMPLIWILIVAYLAFTPFCFFFTLDGAHQAMKDVKDNQLKTISNRFKTVYSNIQESLGSMDGQYLQVRVDEIEQLQRLYKLTEAFPVWPYDWGSIRKILGAMITSILPLIISLISAAISGILAK